MTSKEALDKIKHIDIDGRYPYPNFLKDDVKYKESIEVIEKRLNELENRDTPMKLIENRLTDYITHNQWGVLHCPRCSCVVVHSTYLMPQTLPNFCEVCGQRLDWEEE